MPSGQALELFDAQLGSRHLDLIARQLRAEGAGFYTIGSAGHEGNAAVAAALRPTDPALLHYRSEEHTSELQSRGHLVCRLLLEKKKKKVLEYFTHAQADPGIV